jgi:anti-sigma B factor antagonist
MNELSAVFVVRDDDRPGALRFVGELDMAEVPDVRARLSGFDGDLEINCSGLSFIDSSGLALLVEVHRSCDARGAKLVIVDPSRCVTRMLEISGLDALLDVRRNGSAP